MKARQYFLAAMTLVLPTLAFAHPGHAVGDSFVAGLTHPWSGLDHLGRWHLGRTAGWSSALGRAHQFCVTDVGGCGAGHVGYATECH